MRRSIETKPTVEELRKVLDYEPETGLLRWKRRPLEMFKTPRSWKLWNAKHAGKIAFTAIIGGYLVGTFKKHIERAHVIGWVIFHGRWPEDQLDHINRCRTDNRLENLREATQSQNMFNRQANKTNPTGLKGVHFCKRNGKFSAAIRKDNEQHWLGYHNTAEAAHAAYAEACNRLHGEFARAA